MKLLPPEPAILDSLQVDYLMWSSFVAGEPKPLGQPILLPKKDAEEIASICESFASLIGRHMELCLENPELLRFWSFSPALLRMIEADRKRPQRDLDLLARFDVFPTPDGWKISEFNTDVPGGIHEAAGLNDLIAGLPRAFSLVEKLTELTCRDHVRPKVGIVFASGWGEDLEQCQFLRRAWNQRGVPAFLGNPSNLRWDGKRLRMFGEPIDVLYRFFPAEWLEETPALEGLIEAVRAGAVRMINPFSQLVAQSKKGMAFWWEHPECLNAGERSLVQKHLPRTALFQSSEIEEYCRYKDYLVVKRGFGRVGEQVLVGSLCKPEEWRQELEWPLSEPDEWVVQDHFDVVPVALDGEKLYPCYGAYIVGGKFAGFYTRASKTPFISAEAFTAAVRVV